MTGRLAVVLALVATFLSAFFTVVRPWFLTWGASKAELARTWFGDDIVAQPRPDATVTRAITIDAPMTEVWPWLAQLGQDRGGFYSFELLEDLVGCEMENASQLIPEKQRWTLGDKLWMYPPRKLGGMGHALLVRLDAGRALGFATRQLGTPDSAPCDGSWSFILEPTGKGTTRLIARGRAGGERTPLLALFDKLVFDPIHFVMERKMLEGIKSRAEGRDSLEGSDVAQVGAWLLTFTAALAALSMWLWRSGRALFVIAFAWAATAFQILTFCQPALAVALPLAASAWVWVLCAPAVATLRLHGKV